MSSATVAIAPTPVDHLERLASAQAHMRAADTAQSLGLAINAMDAACAGILAIPARTSADIVLRDRAQDWVDTRTRQVISAHKALAARDLYRVRRVAPGRPKGVRP